MRVSPVFCLLLMLLISNKALTETTGMPLSFTSGEPRTALIELYTSEGCSSCPPADRWLGSLKDKAGLWTDFVPIAFHVDYWDYLGWKDRFARARFSNRQRRFAADGKARFVYTPGFFRNGQEWRGWTSGRLPQADKEKAGVLSLSIDGNNIEVHFAGQHFTDKDLTAYVATLGMDLATRVGKGENNGKTLHHDFVALDVTAVPMQRTANGYTANLPYSAPTQRSPHQAIAAWVSAAHSQTPIQSVGGYL